MHWLIATDHLTPAREYPIVLEEEALDITYSKLMAVVIAAREGTNDPVLYYVMGDGDLVKLDIKCGRKS